LGISLKTLYNKLNQLQEERKSAGWSRRRRAVPGKWHRCRGEFATQRRIVGELGFPI